MRRLATAVTVLAIGGAALAACSSSGSSGAGAGTTTGSTTSTTTSAKQTINIAAPQCAHCLAMYLLTDKIPGYTVNVSTFKDFPSLLAGLASGSVSVAQIDYTGLLSMVDKGAPVVAISGEVNGGSDFVVSPKLALTADDWTAFKSLVAQDKAAGKPLKIASQFGTVQDIELRLELPAKGISNSDVDYVNVPYQGMAQALATGAVSAAIPVQPNAATITNTKVGVHFAYPYEQPANNLTNVVVANKAYADAHPDVIQAIAKGLSALVDYLPTPQGQTDWAAAIEKYAGTNAADTATAMAQLKPDLNMPFSQIVAVAQAMYAQKLITHNFTADQLKAFVDYAPLSAATGKTSTQLGDGS
jgi:ABC-type nitrate/sulfonate/bicarbonate transport system substrate-binding protein